MSRKKKNKKIDKTVPEKKAQSPASSTGSTQAIANSEPEKKPITKNPKSGQATDKSGSKTRTCVSVPGFLAGLFLSLILGIYIGTLLPEVASSHKTNNHIIPSEEKVQTDAISNQSAPRQPVLPPDLAKKEKELLQSLTANPSQENLWIELGDLYFDAHLPTQSINAYSHALAINPTNPDVLTDMGVMYRETGNYEKALECFRNAYAINPAHSQSRYNEGIVLSNDLHQHDEAKKAWQELLKYKPNAISPNGTPIRKLIEEQN